MSMTDERKAWNAAAVKVAALHKHLAAEQSPVERERLIAEITEAERERKAAFRAMRQADDAQA